jgi:hypothetical protein
VKRRAQDIEADVVQLIITTREKFPHSVAWTAALKRVLWRYTHARGRATPAPSANGKPMNAQSIDVTIQPLTPERLDDYLAFFDSTAFTATRTGRAVTVSSIT